MERTQETQDKLLGPESDADLRLFGFLHLNPLHNGWTSEQRHQTDH